MAEYNLLSNHLAAPEPITELDFEKGLFFDNILGAIQKKEQRMLDEQKVRAKVGRR